MLIFFVMKIAKMANTPLVIKQIVKKVGSSYEFVFNNSNSYCLDNYDCMLFDYKKHTA